MKTLNLTAVTLTLLFGATALADDEERREMNIVIAGESSDATTSFHWIGEDAGFDMESMQLGETQSIVDESGKSVLITREAEGFRFNIDGETVVIPDMGAYGTHMALVAGSDFSSDIDIEVLADHRVMGSHGADGVTIISGEALDASTKESIKAVLLSAGRDDEVTFIDGRGDANGRHVKIIKQVEVLQ